MLGVANSSTFSLIVDWFVVCVNVSASTWYHGPNDCI